METILPSTPSSYRDIIANSLVLYRASFKKIVLFSLIMTLIVFSPRLFSDLMERDIFGALPPFSPKRLWLMGANILGMIFFIAILWHTHCVVRRRHEPFIEDIQVAIRKIALVFVASIIESLIMFGFYAITLAIVLYASKHQLLFSQSWVSTLIASFLFLGLFYSLVYVATLFIFIIPLIVVENCGIFRAIENSVLLVWNHWWRVFSIQLTPAIVYLFVLLLLRMTLNIDIHLYFTQESAFTMLPTVINMGIFMLFVPWVAALLLTQLKDLELRKNVARK